MPNVSTPLVFGVGRSSPEGVRLLGTCFPVAPNIMATAAHVTERDDTGLVIVVPNVNSLNDFQDTTNTRVNLIATSIFRIDPIRDIALLRFDGHVGATASIGSLAHEAVNTDVFVYGFPQMDAGRFVATVQKASLGAKILESKPPLKVKHAVVNVQSSKGQSGSPVFRASDYKLLAMILGPYVQGGSSSIMIMNVNVNELHQTTYAVDADYIREMLS